VGVILDSNIWIALAADTLNRSAAAAALGDETAFVSVFTLGELHFGVESCREPAERGLRAAFLRQLESQPALGVTRDTAAAFGVLAAAVKHAGRSPRPRYNDLWIAAQAIEHGYSLLTNNPGDFAGLPGLRLARVPRGR
jgi:predicted nucleic acid-binding protein